MTDFIRLHGQHVKMPKVKLSLFREAVQIISSRKDYSLSASVDNIHYKEIFSMLRERGRGSKSYTHILPVVVAERLPSRSSIP